MQQEVIQEKIESLKTQSKALKNTNTMSVISLKHNATVAVALAVDIIQDLADEIADLKKKRG